MRRCEQCCHELRDKRAPEGLGCPGCELYNAAVVGAHEAAASLARDRANQRRIGRTWVNEYGFFAEYDGVHVQIGTAEEAAPFDELTTAAIRAADGHPRTSNRKDKLMGSSGYAQNPKPLSRAEVEVALGFTTTELPADLARALDRLASAGLVIIKKTTEPPAMPSGE